MAGTSFSSSNPGDYSTAELLATVQWLRLNQGASNALQRLGKLREYLNGLGPEAASRTVQRWLDSGLDAPTYLSFKLATDGHLKTAPTLRLFLLDYLIQLEPGAGAAYGEKILRVSKSPDEWAVAMRGWALGNPGPDGTAFLQVKMREMLQHEDWRENPSPGFLEAFDVIVYTRDAELTPNLAGWARQSENRALAHAAYLTLDRLIQTDPAGMLGRLQTQPELLAGREASRADFFARADVRDLEQLKVLEGYLLDPSRSAAEWRHFASVYPNANFMVSDNLLTRTRTPTGDEIAARDREALKIAIQWAGDPRFAAFQSQLKTIQSRLEGFVGPAGNPPK